MRDRRDAIAVAVVLVSMLALAVLLRTRERAPSRIDPRSSTFLATPMGARALLSLADELDMLTRRRLESYTTPPADDVRLTVVLAPSEAFTPREVRTLLDWVRDGGTLFYAMGGGRRLADSLGLYRKPLEFERSVMRRGRGAVATASAVPLVAGVGVLDTFHYAFTDSTKPLRARGALVLGSAREMPTVLSFGVGAGRVIAFSDVAPLTNDALRDGGVALLFARVAEAAAGASGIIEFDENHHGYRAGGGPWAGLRSFLGTSAGYTALQFALAGVLLLLLAARRFGEPHRPPPARRRSPIEHVEALATAYQRAGARRTARKLLLEGLQRRLGRRSRPRPGGETAPPPGLERSAAGQRLIEEWQRGEEAHLVTLSQAVDDVVAEVRRW
jgi:hypothetical protein